MELPSVHREGMSVMATLTRSTTIEAPAEEVYDYAVDIRNLWVIPDVGLADVDQRPGGVGSTAKIFNHFFGLHFEMKLEILEAVRPDKLVLKITSNTPDRPLWTLLFETVDDGTKLTMTGEWHVNVPGIGGPMEEMQARAHKDMVDGLLANVKSKVEALVAA
jgi:uncharacterized protein YndB with AHSA1/START domain